MKKLVLLVASLALVATACGGGEDDAAALPINDGVDPAFDAATCLAGEADCGDDTPGGEPTDLPQSSDDKSIVAVPVVDAISTNGLAVVTGFLVDTGGEYRLCEALAESFPPQCGGASIALTSIDQIDPDDLQTEGSVTWTDYAVTISGEMVDGTLVAAEIE